MRPSISNILPGVFGITASGWMWLLQRTASDKGLGYDLIRWLGGWPAFILVIATVIGLVCQIQARKYHDVRRFMRYLHERLFPASTTGGLHEEFRISLLLPETTGQPRNGDAMSKRMVSVPTELNTRRVVNIRGILIRAALSPFDFPSAAEVQYDEGSREFTLRFAYPGPIEREVRQPDEGQVTLYVGEKSGRLFTVVIRSVEDRSQVPNIAIDAIFKIQKRVEQAASEYPYMEWLNYAAAMDFLNRERQKIVA